MDWAGARRGREGKKGRRTKEGKKQERHEGGSGEGERTEVERIEREGDEQIYTRTYFRTAKRHEPRCTRHAESADTRTCRR
eukprot:6214338-Pleurochrysis_carterae.AAC.1